MTHTEWGLFPLEERKEIGRRFGLLMDARFRERFPTYENKQADRETLSRAEGEFQSYVSELRYRKEPIPVHYFAVEMSGTTLRFILHVPDFVHDCDECTFLGKHNGHDLYSCTNGNSPTLIARFGDGPDYKSGAAFVGRDPEITEAYRRMMPQ